MSLRAECVVPGFLRGQCSYVCMLWRGVIKQAPGVELVIMQPLMPLHAAQFMHRPQTKNTPADVLEPHDGMATCEGGHCLA